MNAYVYQLTEAFLESYQSVGGINHLDGSNLPSRPAVQVIISDMESLLFPGFKSEEAIAPGNLKYWVSETLSRLMRNMASEIERSLCWERRIKDLPPCVGQGSKGLAACRKESEDLSIQIMQELPRIREMVNKDVEAAFVGDPAAKSREEIILAYPGVEAIAIHRVAHEIWNRGIPLLPRMMSEIIHGKTGIDIHPGAKIGEYFFIDHATGIVIGETTEIGRHVKIYQGVTLGALSVAKDEANLKRHPSIEDRVTIYAGATILGGKTVIGADSIIGGNVWLTSSVPAGSKIYNRPADYVVKNSFTEVIDFQI